MEIRVHPRVKKYLDKSDEKERLKEHLKELMNDPYTSRSGVDIKKLRGKKLEEGIVWIERAFKRGKEYQ